MLSVLYEKLYYNGWQKQKIKDKLLLGFYFGSIVEVYKGYLCPVALLYLFQRKMLFLNDYF